MTAKLFNRQTVVAFDVDGTLVDDNDRPRKPVINGLMFLHGLGNIKIIVWSGGGKDYAAMWVRRLALDDYVDECHAKDAALAVDIAFDDMEDCKLGAVNIKV